MSDPRLTAALDRIERALERLERHPPRADGAALEQRHARLRAAAAETLAGLDRLLERRA